MSNTPMTVDRPISAGGRRWMPGEHVDSAAALERISEEYLVPLEPEDPEAARAEADGASWYKYQTVKSVKESVGGDPERAVYALQRERERPKDSQRRGVFDYLIPLVPEDDEGADDDEGEE